MRTLVIDTNVLLADPGVLLSFPDAEIIIPETVLGELDKLKTSRVDPDLRFRGREVSRILFELSEQGSLIGGVDLPDGGKLRVVPLDSDSELPENLSTRNADDRILAVAFQVCREDCDSLTMLTNDLNMLLKAQSLGLAVERHGDGVEGSFARRYIIRPFQRYRIPLAILAIALAVFAAIVVVTIYGARSARTITSVPTEFREQLSPSELKILDYLQTLSQNENDLDTRLTLANLYYELRIQTGDVRYSTLAIRHYEKYREAKPDANDVRTDLAASYFYAGQTDRALQEAVKVLEKEPDHIQANFNLGIFYWKGRTDYPAAASQFQKVIELTQGGDERAKSIREEAQTALDQVKKEAEAAGQPLPSGGTL
ncbi:MAG: PIN domain-containing protein [Actinomycetota bacterium]|nr:PIN domain-containing protein [Actinomycetota bacterium]